MDPWLLDSNVLGLQATISHWEQSWQNLRIQMNWGQIMISRWKRGLRSAPLGNILEQKTKWPSSSSKTWKKWKYIINVQVLMGTCLETMQIWGIYVFNEVWAGRPLKNYWYHGYNMGDNRDILTKRSNVGWNLIRRPFKLR